MRPALGDRMWSQEYECDFLGTGDTFINADTLRRMTDNTEEEYISKMVKELLPVAQRELDRFELILVNDYEMPANNRILYWKKISYLFSIWL